MTVGNLLKHNLLATVHFTAVGASGWGISGGGRGSWGLGVGDEEARTRCSFVKLSSLTDGSSGMIHECGFVN
jgi:hypothetical protein